MWDSVYIFQNKFNEINVTLQKTAFSFWLTSLKVCEPYPFMWRYPKGVPRSENRKETWRDIQKWRHANLDILWSRLLLMPHLNVSFIYKSLQCAIVSNNQGGDLGCSVCLLELPVSLAQMVVWERAVKVSWSQSN